ncbi:FKBP-type peptidyl-prolyl cis-trans isomerase [Flavisolibacter ginsenosidimutans]|uniref:Peptidyl-prolyl cis-trans isomerase n=1 Tax=Flavisolibacter ginsenosidimutans TaxID=661481 RepID=A0A5B8UFT9_9BACT|nr:FKBP-type peptidyl-prolyl cis-trans isomerase [Flavisolibacter ginsenosidimutans]QEC54999.1 FKBP-type peptidyl-prolyl cis-trans isomerase [Flavisolibacter ginsenosidimutans]
MGLFDRLQSAKNEKLQKEKEEGMAFMQENKSKEGVVELPSGIQYQILKEGTGEKPTLKSTIKAHYRGALLSGKEFDSSFKRNQPFTAKPTQLIQGWQEVLPMMPVGSTWRLWLPSHLAYGDNGTGGIPGGATLVFDIELLEIL